MALVLYLSNCTQFENVNGSTSERHVLQCGVPQGPVLGPLLYSLKTSPLTDIPSKNELRFSLLFMWMTVTFM